MKPASFGHGCHFPTVTQGAIRIMRISSELFQEMLNRSISVVCLVRSMVNYDQFQITDHVRICCGCVSASMVIYGLLQSLAVNYRRNKIFEHVENRTTENQDCRNMPVDPGTKIHTKLLLSMSRWVGPNGWMPRLETSIGVAMSPVQQKTWNRHSTNCDSTVSRVCMSCIM